MTRRSQLRPLLAALLLLLAVSSCTAQEVHAPPATVTTAVVPEAAASPSPSAIATARSTPVPAPTSAPATAQPTVEETRYVVALDPGHGAEDYGVPLGVEIDGQVIREKELDLMIAEIAADYLRAKGFEVVLTREEDELANKERVDLNGDGEVDMLDDLQARIDAANDAGADVFLSIHLNAFDDPSAGGTQTFYCNERPFGQKNQALASLAQRAVVEGLQSMGYDVHDRGIALDSTPDDPRHMVVLGPVSERTVRPTEMPGALLEALYMSNPKEAKLLAHRETLVQIGTAIGRAIEKYFEIYP